MWRDLLLRLSTRLGGDDDRLAKAGDTDSWAAVGRIPRPDSEVLTRIEQTALEIYAAHGLPTQPGHYRRGRRARSWTFLGHDLTPEDRWALLMERPPEQGWRYGSLADIGRTGVPDVRSASALLVQCGHLRVCLAGSRGSDVLETLEAAIRLGADWHAVEGARSKSDTVRLRLTVPDDAVPTPVPMKRPRRKKARAE